jgi:zinc D-Ala-D-Ala carboxypeptidase
MIDSKDMFFWSMIKHFSEDEFICGCGCGLNNISLDLVSKLEKARLICGVPFYITSACRCSKHNKSVGGSSSSSHLVGTAVDILCKSGPVRQKILTALVKVGFERIGVASEFIHVDIDSTKNKSIWVY